MESLNPEFLERLHSIKAEIQASAELTQYLDDEEDESFKALQQAYEPKIQEVYDDVANNFPLQLILLEQELLDSEYEGLFLPRILGYSVLRGDIGEDIKYVRPQNHFRAILDAICNSMNFDSLKNRIGQSIQIGFALSSGIWRTNFLNDIGNKHILEFLESQVIDNFIRDTKHRHLGLVRYKKQFVNSNFHTTVFPENITDLRLGFNSLKTFINFRSKNKYNNANLIPYISKFLANDEFVNEREYVELLIIISMSFELPQSDKDLIERRFGQLRADYPNFENVFFEIVTDLLTDKDFSYSPANDGRISPYISKEIDDELTPFFRLNDTIHSKGYIHEVAIEEVRQYYEQNAGVSMQNTAVRSVIMNYFASLMDNLDTDAYKDYMDINKTFVSYMNIFSNEQFNQDVKGLCLRYIKKLLKVYIDKRGKDYQEIKKFVKSSFSELGFMSDKELVELFKTKRKKKPVAK